MKSTDKGFGMNAADVFEPADKLRLDIEEKFLDLGGLYSQIKAGKAYLRKGYDSFKCWVEQEHNIGVKQANKLIRLYRVFVEDMDQDAETLKEIGFDRLMIIAPIIEKADWNTRDEVFEMAQQLPIEELLRELKKAKDEARKEEPQDLKRVLVDQWKDQMCSVLNCSWQEAQFKLALWFSSGERAESEALTQMRLDIRDAQAQFEREVVNVNRT